MDVFEVAAESYFLAQAFFATSLWQLFISIIRAIFTVVSVVLAVVTAIIMWRLWLFNRRMATQEAQAPTPEEEVREKFSEKWEEIRARAESADPNDYKYAVVEADAILDDALERAGIPGASVAEKLTEAHRVIGNIDAIWAAHWLRNTVAHDHNAYVSPADARRAIEAYQQALQELNAI